MQPPEGAWTVLEKAQGWEHAIFEPSPHFPLLQMPLVWPFGIKGLNCLMNGLRDRHAQSPGLYHIRHRDHCYQPSAGSFPSTPSALCDWDTAVWALGRGPATVTLLHAAHKRATRVSLYTQAPPQNWAAPYRPRRKPSNPVTLYWHSPSGPPGLDAQRSAWHWSQRLQNIFPVGLPDQELLPLPTTVPTGPARLPSTLAFKCIQSHLPQSPLPTIESSREGHLNSPPSRLPSLIMTILYSPASVCGISCKKERGRLATWMGLRKRWEGSDFHVIIHFYKSCCQVHTGNTAVVLFS